MSLFAVGSVTFSLWPVSRVFPNASDYVAGYICYVFGFMFGFNLMRADTYENRLIGLILSALHGGLVVGSAANVWAMYSSGADYSWLATLLFAGSWCAGVVVWQSRLDSAHPTTTEKSH
jgi:hypothetical protein